MASSKEFDKTLSPIALALLSKVPQKEAVFVNEHTQIRAQCFRGSRLVSTLTKDVSVRRAIDKQGLEDTPEKLAQDLLSAGFFTRVEPVDHPSRFVVKHKNAGPGFTNDDIYVWVYTGDKKRQMMMSVAFIITVFGLFLIKIWPIWLKICVYWVSLTMLVTMSSILGVRLVLFCAMWLVGFRGLWLFPNLLSDELGVWDSFMPLFGRGVDMEEMRRQRRKERKRLAEAGDSGSAGEGAQGSSAPLPLAKNAGWNFGMINALAIFFLGILYCHQIGMFSPQLVPNFVATHKDLYAYFPAIGPPEPEKEKAKRSTADELFEKVSKEEEETGKKDEE